MILANMASNQQFVTNLIEKKIIRVAAPLLIDKSFSVRHAIAGSLRMGDESDQKQREQTWSPVSMAKAVIAVKDRKMNLKEASEVFKVPEVTLLKLFNDKYKNLEHTSELMSSDSIILNPNLKEGCKNLDSSIEQKTKKEWSALSMIEAIETVKEVFDNSETASQEKTNHPASLNTYVFKVENKCVQQPACSSLAMEKAIEAVKLRKMGQKKAAAIFGVPRKTLRRLLKNQYSVNDKAPQPKKGVPNSLIPRQKLDVLNTKQEIPSESMDKLLETARKDNLKSIKTETSEIPTATSNKFFQSEDSNFNNVFEAKPEDPNVHSSKNEVKILCKNAQQEIVTTCEEKSIEAGKEMEIGYKNAAEKFQVPKTTLKEFCGKKDIIFEKIPQQISALSPILEIELIKYFSYMETMLFDLTLTDVKCIANQLAKRNNIKRPFGKGNTSGRKWLKNFFREQKNLLSVCQPSRALFRGTIRFNLENVNQFFNSFLAIFKKQNYPPSRIFTVGVYSFAVLQRKVIEIISLHGERHIHSLNSTERDSLITCIVCMAANGEFIPPLLIFPKCYADPPLKMEAFPGTIFDISSSGWVNVNLFTKWFRHFLKTIKPTRESPVLLIFDGLFSYTHSIDVVDLARDNHVTMISLPISSSKHMHPLNKTFIPQLKTFYLEEIREWLIRKKSSLNAYDVVSLFEKAYIKSQTPDTAINGFKLTGIFPINRNIFNELASFS